MAEVILMPRLSDTMTEGVIAAWHKNVGDAVKKGDLLAEIETDKATMELESYQEGVLLHIGTTKGGKLQVNDLLAIIGKAGEDVASLIASVGASAPAAAPATEPTPAAAAPTTPLSRPPGAGDTADNTAGRMGDAPLLPEGDCCALDALEAVPTLAALLFLLLPSPKKSAKASTFSWGQVGSKIISKIYIIYIFGCHACS